MCRQRAAGAASENADGPSENKTPASVGLLVPGREALEWGERRYT